MYGSGGGKVQECGVGMWGGLHAISCHSRRMEGYVDCAGGKTGEGALPYNDTLSGE